MTADANQHCRFLRAKNGYGKLEGGGLPFFTQDTVTTTYRCISTGEPFGPDYQLAHTSTCTIKRGCFETALPIIEHED
ncbi:MAG: hypothetical protein K2X93_03835 [Candidatus Obscuribacterales bacterium]|nr:hypothetical protein [Candidatus Obscuribacterales bacterium]